MRDKNLLRFRFAQDVLQISPQVIDKFRAAMPCRPARARLHKRSLNMVGQLRLIPRNGDHAHLFELPGRLNLVIVPVLPATMIPRHDDYWDASIQAGKNRPSPSVRDHQLRSRHRFGILRPIKKPNAFQARIVSPPNPYLRENLRLRKSSVGPIIDSRHEPLKRKLSADRDEDHSSDPR
jgi:hypothetical protein